ncbi:hypothetical protein [Microseira wollei]|nr:hypothetical protein [Microseira wollei]
MPTQTAIALHYLMCAIASAISATSVTPVGTLNVRAIATVRALALVNL